MMRARRLTHLTFLVCGVGSAGCGSADEQRNGADTDALARTSSAIINGFDVSQDNIGTVNILYLNTPSCTGTMLAPTWVLTADHCIRTGDFSKTAPMINPHDLTVKLKDGTNQPSGVRIVPHPTLDVALVALSEPPLDPTWRIYTNRLYRGTNASLQGQTLYAQAWGMNTITSCTAPGDGMGRGTLRWANMTVSSTTDTQIGFVPNTYGQINWRGDSGGSAYKSVAGLMRPTGVTNSAGCSSDPLKVTSSSHLGAEAFRDWANGVVGNAPTLAATTGYDRSDGVNALVYVDAAGSIKELSLQNGNWSGPWPLPTVYAVVGGQLSAFVRADSVNSIVYRGAFNYLHELTYTASGWQAAQIVGPSGPLAATPPSTFVRSDRTSNIVYLDTSNHVRMLWRPSYFSSWAFNTDLTATAINAPPNGHPNHPPVGYNRADGLDVVVFTSADGHIWEISPSGSNWIAWDLTQSTGAPAAVSNVRPYSRSDGVNAVLYIDQANNVQELSQSPGANWVANPILAAPTARSIRPYVRSDGYNAIIHQSTFDNDIREIWYQNNTWHAASLTAIAIPAPAPAADPNKVASGYVRADNINTVVYQAQSNGHIIELSYLQGAWHWTDRGGP